MNTCFNNLKRRFFSECCAFFLLIVALIFLIGIVFLSLLHMLGNSPDNFGYMTSGIACVISIANAILLYLALMSQNEGNKNFKDISKQERFEATLFNLWDKYFEQLHRINFETVVFQDSPNLERITVNGSSFIAFVSGQLSCLKAYFEKDYYLGYYIPSSDDLGYDYKNDETEIREYDELLRIKYMANIYGISNQCYEECKKQLNNGDKTLLQISYQLFYSRWGIAYDHYLRSVQTIVAFIKNGKDVSTDDYMALFMSYISDKERRFLNYHARIDDEFAKVLKGTPLYEIDL